MRETSSNRLIVLIIDKRNAIHPFDNKEFIKADAKIQLTDELSRSIYVTKI